MKKNYKKALHLGITLILTLITLFAFAGRTDTLSNNQQSLVHALNPDGTLKPGINGSFNTEGFRMAKGKKGEPVFALIQTDGNELWSGLDLGLNGTVRAIAISGTDVYVGGDFTQAGGKAASNVAKWNGTTWSALGSGVNGPVFTIAISGVNVYVGGHFSTGGGNIAKWDGNIWSGVGTGVNDAVYGIAISGTDVYAVGFFTKAGGNDAGYVARWNGANWSNVGGPGSVGGTVRAIAVSGSNVYVGGNFNGYVSRWNGSRWNAMGTGVNGIVHAIAVSGTDVYVGGDFTSAGNVTGISRVAKWNGSTWSALGTGVNSTVNAIAVSGTDVYVGGAFNQAGGNAANRIVKWDGGAWSTLGAGVNNAVRAIGVSGTDVYTGGAFSQAGGVSNRSGIAVYHAPLPPLSLHVNSSISTSGDGKTWATAYKTLKEALDFANANTHVDSIKVATGTYYPTGAQNSTNRDATFAITRSNLKILGGYAQTGGNWERRPGLSGGSILSGDIGTANNHTDNSYHVMVLSNISHSTTDSLIIDGFTISRGNADGRDFEMFNDKAIHKNRGGGLYTRSVNSNTVIRNCIISNNVGETTGGGIYNDDGSSPIISHTVFSNNTAASGGGMYNDGSSPRVLNSIFSNNTATNNGGGMYNSDASPLIANSTFSANTATGNGNSIYGHNGNTAIVNSILWSGNAAKNTYGGTALSVSYSNVQQSSGVYSGTGNLNTDPKFVNTANAVGNDGIWGTTDDGLRLSSNSLAINAGNNAAIPNGITTDITGAARIQLSTIDMGAYEGGVIATLHVNAGISTSGDGKAWATAYKTLKEALDFANANTYIDSIKVATGTYYPTGQQNGTNRDASFAVTRSSLKILGGYVQTGGNWVRQSGISGGSILSGDIGTANNHTDNTYHVMVLSNIPHSTTDSLIIDGFTISGGNADGRDFETFNGLRIYRERGGGISIRNVGSNTVIRNCVISNNMGATTGGGIYNDDNASPVISYTVISNNTAASGGGMYNDGSSPRVLNSIFSNNTATNNGGGMYNSDSSPFIANSTFAGNMASANGYSIYSHNGNTSVVNSILLGANLVTNTYGPLSVSYSNVRQSSGVYSGTGNLNADPQFVNAANPVGNDGVWGTADDGLRLGSNSPAINVGSNAAVPTDITTDIAGVARIQSTTIDMGAYEVLPHFTTVWDLSKQGPNATQITFFVTVDGPVNYTWSTSTASGFGTIANGATTATITGLSQGATVQLNIVPANLKAFRINNGTDRQRLVDVKEWGNVNWNNMADMFRGCNNLEGFTATDAPNLSNVTNMSNMFYGASTFNGDISGWNTSAVTNMNNMFNAAIIFNGDLSGWNTSAVTNMNSMFKGARAFNGNISGWNTSAVTNMSEMFIGAAAFNGDMSGWNTSRVTNMSSMFNGARAFNGDISGWNTSRVTNMSSMFNGAASFNGDLSGWNTSAVTDMGEMFNGAASFNGDLSGWSTSAVINMFSMFNGARAFNGDLSGWNTGRVTNMNSMFFRAAAFNGDISGWNTEKVSHMGLMFCETTSFNRDISGWNTSAVTDMFGMFLDAKAFNQNLGNWTLRNGVDLTIMLSNSGMDCVNYSATLTGWANNPTTPSGRNLGAAGIKYGTNAVAARNFLTRPTANGGKGWTITDGGSSGSACLPPYFTTVWDLSKQGGNATQITFSVTVDDPVNYTWSTSTTSGAGTIANGATTATITGLPQGATVQLNMVPANLKAFRINSGADRQRLVDVKEWGGANWNNMADMFRGCNNLEGFTATDVPNLSNVTDLSNMFNGASAFNGDLSGWNTSAATNMSYMFSGAIAFNGDISGWNTSVVTNMNSMFSGASAFNGDISGWNTSAVTSMNFMFRGAASFNGDLSRWNTEKVHFMTDMFRDASAFNQNLGNWTLRNGVDLTSMLNNSGMDCVNYSATLTGWANKPTTPSNRSLGAAGLKYGTNAAAARNTLTTSKGWTITDGGSSGSACVLPTLPVTLNSFTATAKSYGSLLNWQTASETNNKGFEIWRKAESLKNKDQNIEDAVFVKIGEVSAAINHQLSTINYTFTDKQPLSGNNYYKLVQVDNDGTTTELGIRTVTFNFQPSTFHLYPNPVKNQLFLSSSQIGETMFIYDVNGKKLLSKQIVSQIEVIDVSALVRGTYVYRIGAHQGKFVKE